MAEIIEISDLGDPRPDAFVRLTGHHSRFRNQRAAHLDVTRSVIEF